MLSVQVQSLVSELRFHMPQGQKKTKKHIKQKQYCNKFNKHLKNKRIFKKKVNSNVD